VGIIRPAVGKEKAKAVKNVLDDVLDNKK